ncbi:MAG: hypothetical protein Q8Q09_10380 [Deltaproteobacteria bacterium]|nr:hypothetical protein [Deltaproteobacteria bacterium]
MRYLIAILLLNLSACGTAVMPTDAPTMDASQDSGPRYCHNVQCPSGQVCDRNLTITCLSLEPMCNPVLMPCDGAECLDPPLCLPCVARSIGCPPDRCRVNRNRANMGFIDVFCEDPR